jgi:hypothetical protein
MTTWTLPQNYTEPEGYDHAARPRLNPMSQAPDALRTVIAYRANGTTKVLACSNANPVLWNVPYLSGDLPQEAINQFIGWHELPEGVEP